MPSAIVPMWRSGTPDPALRGAGFPVLEEAVHTTIFAPDRAEGAYNHHSQLVHHGGAFHALWSNHRFGEDGPGQRILYATSTDARSWSDPVPLFPAPQPMVDSEQPGLVLTAFAWVVVDDHLFAVAGCHENVGFCDFDETEVVPARDRDHPARAREGFSSLAREVGGDGGDAPIFAIHPDRCERIDGAVLGCDDPLVAAWARRLRAALAAPEGLPAWDFRGEHGFPRAADGHRLCEPTVYRSPGGEHVMLLRDLAYSHRMYRSTLRSDGTWAPAVPTDIPDSPSLSTSVVLDDGRILLIGNQMAPRFDDADEVRHHDRDPLTVAVSHDGETFEAAFALRCGVQDYRVSQREVRGRGGGAQYPSAIVHDDQLFVLHSMGKEDIAITAVPLAALAP